MKSKNIAIYGTVLTICASMVPSALVGAPRTTPVTVENSPNVSIFNVPTVKFDPTGNTVKAEQSGAWSVGISSSANTVKTPTQSQMIQCFPVDQVITSGNFVIWSAGNLQGYREARVALFSSSAHPAVTVDVVFDGPVHRYKMGTANFLQPSQGIVTQANFAGSGYQCVFTVPLMSPTIRLDIRNDSGSDITISRASWVYLVN